MKKLKYISFILLTFLFSCSDETVKPDFLGNGMYNGVYYPTIEWRYCDPEELNVDEKKLVEAHNYISDPTAGTDGYMIVKDGYIIAEDYFNEFTKEEKHASFSISKSFTSALIGIAIDKGIISSVEDKFSEYYNELQHDSVQQWKKDIQIKHALTMTSGIDWTEEGLLSNDLIQLSREDDFLSYVLHKSIKNEPGTVWSYNSGESMYLSGIFNITTGNSMLDFANENLLNPIGINDLEWITDATNHTLAGWGINASMHDFARFGYLFLNNGNWDGNQIISEEWVKESTSPFSNEYPFYGYLWWLGEEVFSESNFNLPDDLYMAIGAFGQYIIVIPSENLLIVRMGQEVITQNSWNPEEFIHLVLGAI